MSDAAGLGSKVVGEATTKKKNRRRNRNRNKPSSAGESNSVKKADVKKPVDAQKSVLKIPSQEDQKNLKESPKPEIIAEIPPTKETMMKPQEKTNSNETNPAQKTREQIMQEREAKKLAKQAKKLKSVSSGEPSGEAPNMNTLSEKLDAVKISTASEKVVPVPEKASANSVPMTSGEKSREQIKAEREAKKLAKQAAKLGKKDVSTPGVEVAANSPKVDKNSILPSATGTGPTNNEEKKKPALTKAERRAIQEAQRAAKTQVNAQKTTTKATPTTKPTKTQVNATEKSLVSPIKKTASPTKVIKMHDCKVKLFNHLESAKTDSNLFVNNSQIHPIIARLGEQYIKRTVVGSNARCIAFLNALKIIIQDFETPPKKEFARSLEAFIKDCVDHLHKCRPLAVSVSNAYKHIKQVLTQLPTDKPESELKENLCHFIDTYLENQIGKAALAISCSMQEKISNGDVILTFGCSSLINYIFEEAHRRHVDFRVIVVDSRPFCEGQELLRRLCAKEIPCTYVLINAVSFVMPEVTKVLLGAHALLSNGYVMARTGTAQVALVARSCNVPVLVCCETHKFSERFQTDAIVYNELGNPDDLILSEKCCLSNWQAKNKLSPLNLKYDITPPELVTAVVTEVSILPCTSVPVILRIKPTEIGYYN